MIEKKLRAHDWLRKPEGATRLAEQSRRGSAANRFRERPSMKWRTLRQGGNAKRATRGTIARGFAKADWRRLEDGSDAVHRRACGIDSTGNLGHLRVWEWHSWRPFSPKVVRVHVSLSTGAGSATAFSLLESRAGGATQKTFTFDGFPPMQDSKLKGQEDCMTVRLLYITQTSTNPKITKR